MRRLSNNSTTQSSTGKPLPPFEAFLAAQQAADRWPGVKHADFEAGETLGRATAAQVLAWAQGDRVGLQDPGAPPIGPGYWVWTGGPIVRGNLGARPIFLDSGDEFMPPPPPAFGSAAYLAALAEVRQISDTRTAEQLAIAQYWNINQSGRSNAAMNGVARELLTRYRRSETESARILFLANAATFDALIGCFNAKYHYGSSVRRRPIQRPSTLRPKRYVMMHDDTRDRIDAIYRFGSRRVLTR